MFSRALLYGALFGAIGSVVLLPIVLAGPLTSSMSGIVIMLHYPVLATADWMRLRGPVLLLLGVGYWALIGSILGFIWWLCSCLALRGQLTIPAAILVGGGGSIGAILEVSLGMGNGTTMGIPGGVVGAFIGVLAWLRLYHANKKSSGATGSHF
jgi:hypothetical protein